MNKTVKKISFTALFAAMVFGLTMLHIPIGAGGYIHVGDAMIYLSGLLLGPWAFLAASIGAVFSDLASGVADGVDGAVHNSVRCHYCWRLLCGGSGAVPGGRHRRYTGQCHSGGRQRSGVYCTGAGAGQGRNLQKIEGLSQWLILFIAITTVCI